jgi:hypothetical protein
VRKRELSRLVGIKQKKGARLPLLQQVGDGVSVASVECLRITQVDWHLDVDVGEARALRACTCHVVHPRSGAADCATASFRVDEHHTVFFRATHSDSPPFSWMGELDMYGGRRSPL